MKFNKIKGTGLGIAGVLLSLGIMSTAHAWSSEDDPFDETHSTHLFIVDRALDILQTQEETKGYNAELGRMKAEWAQGLFDADHKHPFYDTSTFASHFYDPDTKTNYLGWSSPNAKASGEKYFNMAGDFYEKAKDAEKNRQSEEAKMKKEKAFYYLGVAMHYFTDLTQPMHASNFSNADHRALGYHSKFENYTDVIKYDAKMDGLKMDKDFGGSREPGDWLEKAARHAKGKFSLIFNDEIKDLYRKATTSTQASNEWKKIIKESVINQLKDAEQQTAGYINLWCEKYGLKNDEKF